ncbi:helix-turn-helix domain-containing protein [Pararobbsia silviterrae]|uniref:Helix-turn-helix domain-containing protein n=2 Tax=Pararobbsia silviterrae TaxID=1792498 RepID=A0A494Y9S1_9BURK|nr:helix-turn-helix domain-containing protein [Pararobbsia silviterrae]
MSGHGIEPSPLAGIPARKIGIVLFEGFSLLRAGVIAEVFNRANAIAARRPAGHAVYTIRMLSFAGGSVPCSSAVHIWTERFDASQYQSFDALFIGGGKGAQHASLDERLLGRMRFGYSDSMLRTTSITRASLLNSGLTTGFDAMSANGQGASHDEDWFASLVNALMLVKCDLGLDTAREIGEQMMPGATPRLAPLLADAGATSVRDKVRASARWLKDNCERPISVADAAQVAAMSERNYLRRFKDEIGVTPSEYLLRARLDTVCRLLIETDLPVDKIARRNGMANGDRLAKIFRKRMLVSPTEYRVQNRRAQVAY